MCLFFVQIRILCSNHFKVNLKMKKSLASVVVSLSLALLETSAYAQSPNGLLYTVDKVVDGDTLHISTVAADGTDYVRIGCTDAPEMGQAYGARSKAALQDLLPVGTIIRAHYNRNDRDSLGRSNAQISIDGKFIGLEMVRSGHAFAHRYFYDECGPDIVDYMDAENDARINRRGLWAEDCAYLPWEFKKGKKSSCLKPTTRRKVPY
jgi:micrococcal nuclease